VVPRKAEGVPPRLLRVQLGQLSEDAVQVRRSLDDLESSIVAMFLLSVARTPSRESDLLELQPEAQRAAAESALQVGSHLCPARDLELWADAQVMQVAMREAVRKGAQF
jgi:hypothetical protein